jgi:hypothetical protein
MRAFSILAIIVLCATPAVATQADDVLKTAVVTQAARFVADLVPTRHLPESITDALEEDTTPLNIASTELGLKLKQSFAGMLSEAENLGISSFDNIGNVSSEFPYFGFIPKYIGAVVPSSGVRQGMLLSAGNATVQWESRCWKLNTASISAVSGGYELEIKVSGSKDGLWPFGCADYYMFANVQHLELATFPTPVPGNKKYLFKLNGTAAEQWDLHTKGVRINLFRGSVHDVVNSVTKTVELLTPLIGKCCKAPSAAATKANLDFLTKYRALPMAPRTAGMLNVSDGFIQSGDFLGVIRLDGLDPMLAWAMGSTTGHTCITMRDEANELHVLESTTNGSYWPVNGIQSTPFETWMQQAQTAGHHVVHVPLSDAARAKFDADKAWKFFGTQDHLDYGYGTLLVGWVDSIGGNFPCLPPYEASAEYGDDDTGFCLTWELVEVLFPIASNMEAAVSQIYLEAWNHRVGVQATGPDCEGCLSPADVLQKCDTLKIPSNEMFMIPEKDEWSYSQTYNNGTKTQGTAMVCDVFVCRMWKAGGIFGDMDLDCGEFTNLDAYDLDILDPAPAKKPTQCAINDPENPHCQLLGKHKMQLNNVGKKTPFPHMAEKCVGRAPDYGFGGC